MQHFHEVICEHLLYSKAIAAPNVKKNYRSTHLVILNQTNYWSTNLLFEIIRSWADKILFIGTKFFQFTQIVLKQFYFRSQPVGFFDKFLQSYFSNWELHLPLRHSAMETIFKNWMCSHLFWPFFFYYEFFHRNLQCYALLLVSTYKI